MLGRRPFFHKYLLLTWILLSSLGVMAQPAFDHLKALPDNQEKADSLLSLAKSLWYTNPEEAIRIGKYTLGLAEKNDLQEAAADALNSIGAGFYFLEIVDSAAYYFNLSLEISTAIDYIEGISRVSNNLGLIHDFLGNYDAAIGYYFKSLEIEQNKSNSIGIATSYLNIANIYYYLEDFDKALEYMTNSLRIYQENKDENGILRCFTNIGSVYSEIGIYESALSYANKALKLSRQIHNPDLEAANLNNIGKVYFIQGDFKKAVSFYTQAYDLEVQHEDLWSQANTLRNIGGVYLEQNELEQALDYFQQSLALAQQIKAKNLLHELYNDFVDVYKSKKDFEKALLYQTKYYQLHDSLSGEKSRTEISKIESSFRLKYKDQQLDIARNENEVKNLTIKTQRMAIYIFAVLGLLFLAVVFILYFRAKANKQAEQLMSESNKRILDQKTLLEQSLMELKASESKYKALASSIQDGMVIIVEKKLVFANKIFAKMLGYSNQEELLRLNPEDALSAEDLELVLKNYRDRIKGKNPPNEYSINLSHKSGKQFAVGIRVNRTEYQGKQAIIATIKDLSNVISVQSELIQAKEHAEKATKSKSMFLASMSHEIRNHLNGIIGISEVFGDTKLTEEQKNYLTIIRNAGDTLMNIINEILDLTKIEAGQIILDEKEFSVKSMVRDVISLHKLEAKNKALKLKTTGISKVPGKLIGDPVRLSQILTNLIGNAIKFTEKGGVTLAVECIEQEEQHATLRFRVVDTGIGISKESLDKLFKPFSQTHAALERDLGGTGLGLAISKQLVKIMDGDIGVQSKPGKGSEFWFTLSFQLPASNAMNKINGQNGQSGTTYNILLVEDNLLNQHLTTTILKKEGLQTAIASNGQEGVDLYRQRYFDVILMDIQMPVMDGIEATQLIREYEKTHYNDRSTIIAISAHVKESDKQRLKEVGIDHYLQKPFKPEDLMGIIRKQQN